MITAQEAKNKVLADEKRSRAFEQCKFMNERNIRMAVHYGLRHAYLHSKGYPCILHGVNELSDDDWCMPFLFQRCCEWENDSDRHLSYDFESEIKEWLKQLGYRIEYTDFGDGYYYYIIW